MEAFAELFRRLDETTRTNLKVDALKAYFGSVPPEDAVWAVSFLVGRKPRRVVPTRKLIEWAAEEAGVPEWLFEASYDVVGDLAETITLLLPCTTTSSPRALHVWVEEYLLPLREMAPERRKRVVVRTWQEMDTTQRFVWNKLITGGFRVGVSGKLVARALAETSGIAPAVIAHRLMGRWRPTRDFYQGLLSTETGDADISRPYPFYLAYPLNAEPASLGDLGDWQVEWKWDGIRGQVVKRRGEIFVWSRGEELVGATYPEICRDAGQLPDGTVIDGEILAWRDDRPLPFSELQRRIGRKTVARKLLDAVPACFLAYDLLELAGQDVRDRPLDWRRPHLEKMLAGHCTDQLRISPLVDAGSWDALGALREESRRHGVEGFMLKRRSSRYRVGRRRGDWWKWKVDPLTVDAVLIYAQRGHGRRSGLYTDYTFAVRDGDGLVPFAKAYSGLSDAEIRRVDRFIQRNTLERFGPVRSVKPELVFEIAFDGIQASRRHKSGVAVRFPRIARWREDKSVEDADTVERLQSLLQARSL
jgi:DNA ligase-1